ncbi:uncharacterized protein LOC142340941 isoform X2 [Convolutriloba macropyga]|uniref:uncharacterized protein LOC142340941 isoform X2 n=1 Tax=Convolutriloba macropyga TaxID=536237 RepID=UPI003F51EFBA
MFFFGLLNTYWNCGVKIGHGIPLYYLVDGSLLLGFGIIFVCGFDHEASTDSVRVSKAEKEALEQDHWANGLFTSSESSVFRPMTFLRDVLKDGRHIFAVCILSSAEMIEFRGSMMIENAYGFGDSMDFVLLGSLLGCLVFWAIFSTVIDMRIEKYADMSKRYITRPTLVLGGYAVYDTEQDNF